MRGLLSYFSIEEGAVHVQDQWFLNHSGSAVCTKELNKLSHLNSNTPTLNIHHSIVIPPIPPPPYKQKMINLGSFSEGCFQVEISYKKRLCVIILIERLFFFYKKRSSKNLYFTN
jgi:hypothetical protein